jgi:serine/threonine protein phosphatase 1
MNYQMVKQVDQVRFAYFVTDIHGQIELFKEQLYRVGFEPDKGDIVISGGDLIDRGDDSLAVLSLINEDWFHSVKGNHEEMAYLAITENAHEDSIEHWKNNGGLWFYDLSDEDRNIAKNLISKANNLPIAIEVNLLNGKKIGVVHADYPLEEWGHFSPDMERYLLWSRRRANFIKLLHLPELITEISGIDAVVFGHTPMRNVAFVANQVFLDTGSYRGNLAMLSSDEILDGLGLEK